MGQGHSRLVSGSAFRRGRAFRLSGRTRIRLKGATELGLMVARKNPAVDSIATGKEVFDSTYRVVKGKEPPSISLRNLPQHILRIEREEARRERRLDMRFGR